MYEVGFAKRSIFETIRIYFTKFVRDFTGYVELSTSHTSKHDWLDSDCIRVFSGYRYRFEVPNAPISYGFIPPPLVSETGLTRGGDKTQKITNPLKNQSYFEFYPPLVGERGLTRGDKTQGGGINHRIWVDDKLKQIHKIPLSSEQLFRDKKLWILASQIRKIGTFSFVINRLIFDAE